jgi:RNA polymerase sigma-70 factor (ECF subfamily)
LHICLVFYSRWAQIEFHGAGPPRVEDLLIESVAHPTQSAAAEPVEPIAALVAKARANPTAFGALYDRFLKPVYCYLYRRTGSRADAEDLTAQTFLSALEALPRYREQGHFAAWLFAIARRKLGTHWRTGRGQRPLDEISEQGADPDLFGGVVRGEQLGRLNALLGALGEDERELIRLRYVAGLPFGDIAALLSKNEDAVKKSLYRLLARLQNQLENPHE